MMQWSGNHVRSDHLHMADVHVLGQLHTSYLHTLSPHTFIPSHPHTDSCPLITSHPYALITSYPHILTPSLPHTLMPSYPHTIMPSNPHTLIPSCLVPLSHLQVTAYTHKDDNNKWLLKKANCESYVSCRLCPL